MKPTKPLHPRHGNSAFTWIELLVVLVTVVLLATLFHLWKPQMRTKRTVCVNNLKVVGMATRLWIRDSMDGFAWTHPERHGGTMEYVNSAEVFRHFDVESNEFQTPKVLVCPSDPNRIQATGFGSQLSNSNISYFLCLDADMINIRLPLSGDRNITGGKSNAAGLVFAPGNVPGWDARLHHYEGNLGLSDGSVQQVNTQALARQFTAAFTQTGVRTPTELRLAIPRVADDEAVDRNSLWSEVVVPVVKAGSVVLVLAIAWLLLRRRLLAPTDHKLSEEEHP